MRTETSASPLVVFRFGFGLMMLLSIVRFWAYGWIDKLYLQPQFHFSYRYFEWVRPLGNWTYALFAITGLAACCIMVGYRYRLAIVTFFLSFTYIELMDKTTYLNHYYFISLLSLLLCFLPVPRGRGRGMKVGRRYIGALQLFVAVVYFYAGLAKLNSDWLLHAQPLAIWLPAKYSTPLLGDLLQQRWVHYAFAWGGAAYDLLIPFLLLYRPTRWLAFGLVVIFHVLTWVLFPIGMFPYIMIVGATIFLDAGVHDKLLDRYDGLRDRLRADLLRIYSKIPGGARQLEGTTYSAIPLRSLRLTAPRFASYAVAALLAFHLLFPFRYLLHGQELFWTEEGYRFSWRVMLMEKAGVATFTVRDAATDQRTVVDNRQFLTVFQEKQMATQPDFILQYAHFLGDHYRERGFTTPQVYAESYVALNGRLSQAYVNPSVDLTNVTADQPVSSWLQPFQDTIYGL